MAAIPPILPVIAAPIVDLHMVLQVCGFANFNNRTNVISGTGFTGLGSFLLLEKDEDVSSIQKDLSARHVADGRVHMGIVHVKHLQALAWWVRD